MSILDITVVSVALKTFQTVFSATAAQVAWTMTGYTLALASVIPLTGWAADRFGTKRLYLLAGTLFAAGSVLCATANSLEMLGPIFGPILGGWLIDAASWHWIFLINLPIGVLAFGYAYVVLPKDDVEPSESFSGKVLPWVVLGVVLTAAFVPWALRRTNVHPLIELRLLKNKDMTVAVIAMMLFAMTFFGASLLFPLYFQEVRGEDALKAGVLLTPQGIGAMLTMPAAGFLTDKIGPGKIVLTGIAVITVGMTMFTQLSEPTSYTYIIGALFVMGLGMGATMMPIMTAALATLSDHNIARGSTFLNISQQVAASMGTALFSVLLTNGIKGSESIKLAGVVKRFGSDQAALGRYLSEHHLTPRDLAGLQGRVLADMGSAFAGVFVVAAILVALCLVPAFFLPRKPAKRAVDPAAMVGH